MADSIRLDLESVEAVAQRVAELLRGDQTPDPGLVDAATIAKRLNISRSVVYARAAELGGRRIGGPKGRLRFDPIEAREPLARLPLDTGAAPAAPQRKLRKRRELTLRSRPRVKS
jgi:hypothetical protein